MINFIVYNSVGKILRTGGCTKDDLPHQIGENEFVIEGSADDIKQKIINGKIVDKTPEEIEADSPTPQPIPFDEQPANITNKDWNDLKSRIDQLEK